MYFLRKKRDFPSFRPLDSRHVLFVQLYQSFPKLDSLLRKDYSDLEGEIRVMRMERFREEVKEMRKREEKPRWCATIIFARNYIFGRKKRVSGVLADSSGNLFCGDCSWVHPPEDSILE